LVSFPADEPSAIRVRGGRSFAPATYRTQNELEVAVNLREKYQHAIQTAKRFRMDGSAQEKDGKLHFNGTVDSEAEKNAIWDALKTVPDWRNEVVADIRVTPKAGGGAPVSSMKTYTVKKGDTLSRIAREYLGDANEYMKIFNANKDQLSDPDEIKPGQVLKIPAMDKQLR
jgi:nucleoid-associated protein YgaU